MFKRILIANRGEIAMRIIRCCRMLDIETVLVYSTADKDSLPVQFANIAVCIGSAKASESYLLKDRIIETALAKGCDAIHPGFGFLSENADFAKSCEKNAIAFIGPSSKVISMMGNKDAAKKLMKKHKVPVVPGSEGLVSSYEEAIKAANKVGYPILIKAAAGGGGRGMRKAFKESEVKSAFEEAKAEALSCFANGDLYLEKLILNPHHIEVQILADSHGNVIYLGERDCSIQRRNQKLIEESPSKKIDDELRKKMGEAAVNAAKACKYTNAGTVEFVLDHEGNFYFIEMNTRIQVEHPVTEMVTGIDLIHEQLRIASGMKLSYKQEDVKISGHAIECRINAGSPGKIDFLHLPAGFGVRVDSALFTGCEISPHYDPMIAKVIVHGTSRLDAIKRMRAALEESLIDGVPTNKDLQYLVMYHPDFLKGSFDTSFMELHGKELVEFNEESRKEL